MNISRYLKPPSDTFFLFGARGTGKTTWLKESLPNAHWISFLNETNYQQLLASPKLFQDQLRKCERGSWVVIDEVQRIPTLLNEVHLAIESLGLKFALCGSSARKLKMAGVNLLGGRAYQRHMYPFIPAELKGTYSLNEALEFGTLPLVWASEEKKERLSAYVQTYLKEEIQAEALVRNLPGFSRFLPIAALFHGESINASSIGRDAGVARTTVESYINILEETLLAFRIQGFEARIRVKERKSPKLYWVDPGIVRGTLSVFPQPAAQLQGHLFEGLIATILKSHKEYENDFADSINYWNPSESKKIEVDFLLRRGAEFIAIEVKSGANFHSNWKKGLTAISELKGVCRRIIVYPFGSDLETKEGIELLSFESFCNEIENGTLWP